ncbi:hypothetical protein DC080_06900 [Ignatzschineria cameli]|nr:tRNA (adenosine(37)-N6)-threonylcarbamoyltransferase complex ATPase subunit type 1 TsaE [Ignatzschineria cameli]PWD85378.1 hypothetical protein DC080_06900 [Ignatzschineria cameli]
MINEKEASDVDQVINDRTENGYDSCDEYEGAEGESNGAEAIIDASFTLSRNGDGTLNLQLPAEAATAHFATQLAGLIVEHFMSAEDGAEKKQDKREEKRQAPGHDLKLYLHGDLGAGKTTFSRYFIQAFGVTGAVKSPTYTLIEPYEITLPAELASEKGRGKSASKTNSKMGQELKEGESDHLMTIYHADLYRLASPLELYDLGLLEEQGIWLIEWPEKGDGVLPLADIELNLMREGEQLSLRMSPQSPLGEELLATLEAQNQE